MTTIVTNRKNIQRQVSQFLKVPKARLKQMKVRAKEALANPKTFIQFFIIRNLLVFRSVDQLDLYRTSLYALNIFLEL